MKIDPGEIGRELRREIRQRDRALATGALVRPPATRIELEREEEANEAEITHLSAWRSKLWRLLSGITSVKELEDAAYAVESAGHALALAYAAKRRLRVARALL